MQKLNILILYGSRSPEHEISIITALQVMQNLNKEKYNLIPVYINKNGEWILGNDTFLKPEVYKDLEELSAKHPKVTLGPNRILTSLGVFAKKIKVDFVLPVFHGAFGEDGTIQGLLESCFLPYSMSGVLASALGLDKVIQKQVFWSLGLPLVKYFSFNRNQWQKDQKEILLKIKKLKSPWFVKPVCGGSSIGITKAKTEKGLTAAIEVAAFYDQRILVEESVEKAREINISVLGNTGSGLKVSVCEEPVSPAGVLTYKDKYQSSENKSSGMAGAKRVIPAKISKKTREKIEKLAKIAYEGLGCDGLARVDFLLSQDEKVLYINEINTIPGSLSFYLWEKSGIKFPELLDNLIALGVQKFEEKKKTNFTFQTNILSSLDQKLGSKLK